MRTIFSKKQCTQFGEKTNHKHFSKNSKMSIYLYQYLYLRMHTNKYFFFSSRWKLVFQFWISEISKFLRVKLTLKALIFIREIAWLYIRCKQFHILLIVLFLCKYNHMSSSILLILPIKSCTLYGTQFIIFYFLFKYFFCLDL